MTPNDTQLEQILAKMLAGVINVYNAGEKIYDLKADKAALIAWRDEAVKTARHEQRHQELGVSRWIAVGQEHGYWEHPMTVKKIAQLQARGEKTK